MTEKDYILLTNLAKLRCARTILSDVFPDGELITEAERAAITKRIYAMVEKLQKKVKIRE